MTATTSDQFDESLLARTAAGGDGAALERLVAGRYRGAFAVALRALRDPGLAEDATQDAFLSLFRSADRYRPERPFGPWFSTILGNSIRMTLRERRRRRRREETVAAGRPDAHQVAYETVVLGQEVVDRLAGLPEELRRPVELHFLEGRTHAEVASDLGCTVGTASSRIRRGIGALRRSFEATELRARQGRVEAAPADASVAAAVFLLVLAAALWVALRLVA